MTTTSLPDRLRALADLIEQNNLPEPAYVSLLADAEGPASVHVADHDAVCEWAEVLGREVRVQRVHEGRPDAFVAYVVDDDAWSVAWYDHSVSVVPA